jgi:glycosyltransferase involved in cell wall biosynthesis
MVAVTVLLAVYDPPLEMLRQAIDSILKQTFRDFELLIVDDGSRDPKVREYLSGRAASDPRTRVLHEPHRGVSAATNRGLAQAQGQWIARQDADDWSEPERLERQMAYISTHPDTVLCGTNAWTHQENGNRLWHTRLACSHQEILTVLPRRNPFVHGSTVFSREHALAVGAYREEFRAAVDYDFLCRLTESGQTANLAEPLYHYRYNEGSISTQRAGEQSLAFHAARRLALARQRGEPEDLSAAVAWAKAELGSRKLSALWLARLKQADLLMLAGHYGRAGRAYWRFAISHPTQPVAWAKLARWVVFLIPPARQLFVRWRLPGISK